jgi:hypothetical protein
LFFLSSCNSRVIGVFIVVLFGILLTSSTTLGVCRTDVIVDPRIRLRTVELDRELSLERCIGLQVVAL